MNSTANGITLAQYFERAKRIEARIDPDKPQALPQKLKARVRLIRDAAIYCAAGPLHESATTRIEISYDAIVIRQRYEVATLNLHSAQCTINLNDFIYILCVEFHKHHAVSILEKLL